MSQPEESLKQSVYLPESQVEALHRLAKEKERPMSWLVSLALRIAWPELQRIGK